MEIIEHLAVLREEGDRLAAAAARTEPDTPVPTCPEWRMRDLVRHLGGVHRWASAIVAERHTQPPARPGGPWPDDGGLVDWFREGHHRIVAALETAPPDLDCWTFLPATSPLAFWARRQAHETAIHRADAESPAGALGAVTPALAVDGIDELLLGFVPRRGDRLRADPPRSLHVRAGDAGADWLLRIGPQGVEVRREEGVADCEVTGRASDLYLLLWNRRSPDGLAVRGDAGVLELWREAARIG
jgi:uncharacterized protein (TIGR03083 family)